MASQARVERRRSAGRESDETESVRIPPAASTSPVGEVLERVDEVLDEVAREEAERARIFKEKIKSIAFIIPGRTRDPCLDTVRVPAALAEAMLRSGGWVESKRDCGDC